MTAVALLVTACGPATPAPGTSPDTTDQGAEPGFADPLGTAADGLDETEVVIRGDGTDARLVAKVAAAASDRRRGLMGVEHLPDGTGMLFLYDDDRTGGFWMRDTLVPLDIAFVGADGTIGDILAMEPCETAVAAECPTYTPDTPYRSALEVPQGWFAAQDVDEGDVVSWSEPTPPGA